MMEMSAERNHIKVFVSSTVYDFETQLHNVYALLDGYGYDVYMSEKGTIPIDSRLHNFVNCTKGVEDCDIFVGFIRPLLGTGIYSREEPTVTEQEFQVAFDKRMIRFVMADYKVEFAHQYLNLVGHDLADIPIYKESMIENETGENVITRTPNKVIHPQCVALYRKAIQAHEKDFKKRIGNWVQSYKDMGDIARFLESQFRDVNRIKTLLP